MRSIRKFAYAAVLGLSIFTLQPTLVAAEDARGSFHPDSRSALAEVCPWSRETTPSPSKPRVRPKFLMLRGINGTGTDAMMMVNEVETPKPDGSSRLVLVSRDGQSFVSSMELPEYDMTLHFTVPGGSRRLHRNNRPAALRPHPESQLLLPGSRRDLLPVFCWNNSWDES